MIVISGMIGLGKSTTCKVLSDELNIPVYYENVDNNKILPLFYSSSEEEIEKNRYPFLSQLTFLYNKHHLLKETFKNDNCILDRSIYEDYYFAKRNYDLNKINDLEFEIYKSLLNEILDDLNRLKKNKNEIMIYLKGSFNTVIKRIKERGRSFEIDDGLISYYKFLHSQYDDFILSNYKEGQIIIIDVDKIDILLNIDDRNNLIKKIKDVL